MKVIMVTGSSGLVGQGIQAVLKPYDDEKWVFVSSTDADLLDETEVRRLFLEVGPTHVIHLAAYVGGLFKNMQDSLNMFRKNMRINENVLGACYDFKIQHCISCLSTCIFPDKTTYPIDESMLHEGPPHSSNFAYAYAKRNIEILNRCYNQTSSDTLFTSVIPCNVFGPYDNYNLQNAHVIPALIHKTYISKLTQQPLIVFGSGKPLRQFIYSYDLGKLFIKAIREYESPDPIIFSVGETDEISIADVAKEIVNAFSSNDGTTIDIKFDSSFADGQYKKTVSNNKLMKLWPDFKFTPFKEAIMVSVNWFIQNKNIARV